MADVVIIGGGPVGCWTAIQIKLRRPDLDVQIYERRPEYQRDHMLTVQRKSILKHAARTKDKKERELYKDIAAINSSAADLRDRTKLKRIVNLRTLAFEGLLKKYCDELGIGVTYETIESPQMVMQRHPECKIFIGADGAKSKMRNGLLGENSTIKKDLLYSVDVKYKAKGQAAYTKEPTHDKIDVIVVETVGKEQDGGTDIGLRFLVDKDTFDQVPCATAKEPLTLESFRNRQGYYIQGGDMPERIRKFQNIRKQYAGEDRIEGTETISKIQLSQYASKKFALTTKLEGRDRAGWFFVGDAAMGMPFYRAINVGLRMGSELAEIIGSTENTNLFYKALAFEAKRPFRVRQEFNSATAKLRGINLYKNVGRPALRVLGVVGLGAAVVVIGAIVLVTYPLHRGRLM